MTFGDAIKRAIDLKTQALNGDNPKLDIVRRKFNDIQSVDDLAELYLTNKAKKIKTIHILERLYRKEIKPSIGHMLLSKVHPFDIYEIVQNVLSSGRPSISSKVLHLCKNIFKLGVKNCFLDMNPAANYSTSEDAGGNMPPRDIALTEEELEIMFDVFQEYPQKVPEPTYIGFTLLVILGLRKMELLSAKWVDVDLKRQYFHLYEDNTKTKKSLAVPLPDDVLPLFNRLKELSKGSEYVFPARKRSSRGYISDDTVNHTLADLFGKVISKRQPSKNVLGQAGVTDFVVHDLRRTCRTLMASLGVRQEVGEKCLNHNAANIVKIYNRYEYKEERKEAHEKVARLILPMAGFSVTD
jgi:integrase